MTAQQLSWTTASTLRKVVEQHRWLNPWWWYDQYTCPAAYLQWDRKRSVWGFLSHSHKPNTNSYPPSTKNPAKLSSRLETSSIRQLSPPEVVHSMFRQCWLLGKVFLYTEWDCFPAASTTGSSSTPWSHTDLIPSTQNRPTIVEYSSHTPSVFSIFSSSSNHSPYDIVSGCLHHSYCSLLNISSSSIHPFWTEMLRRKDNRDKHQGNQDYDLLWR